MDNSQYLICEDCGYVGEEEVCECCGGECVYYNEDEDEVLEEADYDCVFTDPGGCSPIKTATPTNPRIYPCPTCGEENALTRIDIEFGYRCDSCVRDEKYF